MPEHTYGRILTRIAQLRSARQDVNYRQALLVVVPFAETHVLLIAVLIVLPVTANMLDFPVPLASFAMNVLLARKVHFVPLRAQAGAVAALRAVTLIKELH